MITAYVILGVFVAAIVGISISSVVQSEREHIPVATASRKQLRAWRRERLVIAIRNRWRT